jgi:hypothetical protein
MAGDWIKMRSNLDTDPDVVAIAAELGVDEFSVVGRLHKFWSWADQHTKSGQLSRVTTGWIDRYVSCPGFSEALRAIDWLSGRDGSLELPSWDRHNGASAKARAGESVRKRLQRSPEDAEDLSGHLSGQTSGPEKRREEIDTQTPSAREVPDWKTVQSFAASIGLAEWRAEDEFNKLEANGWVDAKGHALRKWQPYFTRVKGWWESEGRPMARPAAASRNGRQTAAQRDADKTGRTERVKVRQLMPDGSTKWI